MYQRPRREVWPVRPVANRGPPHHVSAPGTGPIRRKVLGDECDGAIKELFETNLPRNTNDKARDRSRVARQQITFLPQQTFPSFLLSIMLPYQEHTERDRT